MRERSQHAGSVVLCLCLIAAFVVAVRAASFDPTAACVSRSRELAVALQQYVQDYDEHLPPMNSPPVLKAALLPYTQGPAWFTCPATGKAYVPNAVLSNQPISAFNADATIAFEDAVPHNGAKTITYLDGTVERNGVVQGDPILLCMEYAHDLVIAALEYAQDNNERLPPTDTQADFQAALMPYVPSARVFVCPVTGDAYIPNPAISGMPLASINQPYNQVEVVEDATPHPDGFSTIAYLDGHVVNGSRSIDVPSVQQAARALMLAVLQYTQDNNEVLPPTGSYSAFEKALSPYVQNMAVFYDPMNNLPFVLNPSVSRKPVSSIAEPATTVFLRAPELDSNGVLYIGYVDGHVAQKSYYIVRTMAVDADNDTRLVWYVGINPHNPDRQPGEFLWDVDPNGSILSRIGLGTVVGTVSGAVEADGATRLLSADLNTSAIVPGGQPGITTVRPSGTVNTKAYGPFDGWTPTAVGAGANDQPVALWDYYDGTAAVWLMSTNSSYVNSVTLSPPAGGNAADLAVGGDNNIRLLWANGDGSATVQTLDSAGASQGSYSVGPVSGKLPTGISVDLSENVRLLWTGMDGSAEVWTIDSSGTVTGQESFPAQAGWHAVKIGIGGDGNLRILWLNIDDTARLDIVQPNGTVANSQTYAPLL